MSVEETEVEQRAVQQYAAIVTRMKELLSQLELDYRDLWKHYLRLKRDVAERPAIEQEIEPKIWVNVRDSIEWHFINQGRWEFDLTDFHACIVYELAGGQDGPLDLEGQTKLVGEIRDNMLTFHIEEK